MTGDDLDDLLDLWEDARDRGQPISPEELCRDRPELLRELTRLVSELRAADDFLEGSTVTARTLSDFSPDGPAKPAENSPERYLDERFLAEGGLGRVFVARDAELPREVALKRLQDRMVSSREGRRRFVLEAEITARLEHPGIVPVYGLGTDRRGQPFYAMRLIRGETMARAIEKFHADDVPARDPGERRVALLALLRAFVATCQTIAYAHSRGVIHRDLKPANVMLGAFGEALVVDWGLAKPIDSVEDDEIPWPSREGAWDATSAGTVKGSPAYMSPEQAEGRVDRIGRPSDVYSLGATLYTLLTGARPFSGNSMVEVLSAVSRGDFPPPSRIKPGIPRALEAVCLKAMSLDPAGRYEGASDLALEIERWISGEPVSAWREPWYDRLRRWSRRHRVIVASAAAAAVMGVIVLALTNGALRDLARRLDASNVSLRAALDDAERNLYARDVDLADRAWWDGEPSRAAALLDECPDHRRGWEWRYLARRNRVGLSSNSLTAPIEALGIASGGRVVTIGPGDAASFGLIGTVRLAAISPDAARVALVMAENAGEIVVAEVASRKIVIRIRPGTAGAVESLSFSADGRSLAMAVVRREGLPANSKEKVSFVTDFEARLVVRSLDSGREEVSDPFAASGKPGSPVIAGGRCFCAAVFGKSVAVFAVRPGNPAVAKVWSGEEGDVAIAPDGLRLAGRGEGNMLLIRDIASGRILSTLRGHSGPIRALTFHPDGSKLASASEDRTIRVWEPETNEPTAVLRGESGPVDRLAFSSDGSRLASASAIDLVVWDPASNSEATVVFAAERAHLADLAATSGGRVAVVSGHRLSWREATTGRPVLGEEVGDVDALASSTRGPWSAVGTGEGSIIVFDSEARIVRTATGHEAAISGLSFTEDGSRLASASRDGKIRIWEAASGREIARFEAGPVVALSPEGGSLASGGDGEVAIIDISTRAIRHRLAGSGIVRRLAFSPDGRKIAVVRSAIKGAKAGDELAVHDVETGRFLFEAGDQPSGVSDAAFSPDGSRLATSDRSGLVVIRETSAGRPLLTLRGPSTAIHRLAFSPDGHRLLAAGGRIDPLGLRGEEAEEFTVWDGRPAE